MINIQKYLLKIYSEKLKELYENKKLTFDDVKEKLFTFINKIWRFKKDDDVYKEELPNILSNACTYIFGLKSECKLILK